MALTWQKNKRYYVSSTCGTYKVSKAYVDSQVHYTAWRIKQDKREVMLGMFDSADEAKARCEHHAQTGN